MLNNIQFQEVFSECRGIFNICLYFISLLLGSFINILCPLKTFLILMWPRMKMTDIHGLGCKLPLAQRPMETGAL